MTGVRLRWIPWALLAWLAGIILLWLTGVAVGPAAELAASVVLQALSGMVVWLVVSRRVEEGPPRDLVLLVGMGVALGMGLAVVSGVLVDLVVPGWPGWLLPAVIAGIVWFWPGVARVTAGEWRLRRNSTIAALVGVIVGLGGIALNLTRYPLQWDGVWDRYHLDMQYFEALSTSIARYGPLDSIFMSGAEVRYHWLGYGWAGQLAETFGTPPFVTLTRVLPIAALVAVMALAASWAGSRSSGWRVPTLAVILIATGGYVGALNGAILNFDSPSETVAAAWLLALVIGFLTLLRAPRLPWPLVATVGFLGFVSIGGKISAGLVGLAGIGLVAVIRTARWRHGSGAGRAWIGVAAAGLGALLAFTLLIAGTATGGTLQVLSVAARAAYVQGLILDKGVVGIAAGTVSLMLAMMMRWWGVAWLAGSRSTRWQDETILGIGLVLGGLVPVVVLSEGVSETWFGLAASAPLSVLSAVGVGMAWRGIQSRAALALTAIAVAPVIGIVTFLWAQGEATTASARFWGPPIAYLLALVAGAAIAVVVRSPGPRRLVWAGSSLTILVLASTLARVIPLAADSIPRITYLTGPVGNIAGDLISRDGSGAHAYQIPALDLETLPPLRSAWSPAFAAAGQELFALTNDGDIVVTNDVASFLVPALGRRLTYLSGASYQWQYGSASTVGDIPDRARISQSFVNDADPAAFAILCSAGVSWMWASHDLTDRRDWAPYAQVVFANDEVTLARIDRTRCP